MMKVGVLFCTIWDHESNIVLFWGTSFLFFGISLLFFGISFLFFTISILFFQHRKGIILASSNLLLVYLSVVRPLTPSFGIIIVLEFINITKSNTCTLPLIQFLCLKSCILKIKSMILENNADIFRLVCEL